MDLTGLLLAIVAVNVMTLLGGCVVAYRRSRRERGHDVVLHERGPSEPSLPTLPSPSRHLDRPSR
jgi:heme/copper-type cytochrome/quinol oxidase subunit 2